jgi:peptidoglycan/xylan/chitin deacetylase (PgdA/CDA1 family)
VLTFDDGPGEDATPLVLDELRRLGAHGTFFLLGAEVRLKPELAREILAGGHELGLHGFAHPRYDKLAPKQARRDLELGLEVIEAETGVRPRWFRPPFGRMSEDSHAICRSLGLDIAYWSSWGLDWEETDADAIFAAVAPDLHPGAIVLLHDTARYGRRASAEPTASALPAIVECARRRGLKWVTLSEGAGEETA